MSVITVKNLTFSYPQSSKTVVNDVSMVIEKGSYVSIVGYNGSGKSSLARLICGLEVPSSGTVEVTEGQKIGIVFQSPKEQLVSGVVSRDTAFGPQNLGLKPGEIELRTIEALHSVDMLDRADSSTSALSLGQTQKVALSGVIAMAPEILILDEAVSMLDPDSRKEILEIVKYWHKCGNTVIQITHDMEVVQESEIVIGMNEGKIFFHGTKKAFIENADYVNLVEGKPLEKTDKTILASKKRKEVTLSVRNLDFSYDPEIKNAAVHNINFDLYRGTLTALTGPSGAGKSTIFELCCGLLEGNGVVQGTCRPVIAQQNAKAALFEAFAADDVAFAPINNGMSGKDLKELVKQSMDSAALPFDIFAERRTFALSGGEQRRLSIAGILAMNSDILFFDEPTAGLDSRARYQVMQMLKSLAAQGKTVMFSTHKRDEADFADREISILEGRIVSDTCFESAEKNEGLSPIALSAIKPSSSVSLLNGLRSASLGLSGAKKKKRSILEKLPAALRIAIFLTVFIISLAVRPVWLCATVFLLSLIYCIFCGFSLKKLWKAWVKIFPFLLFFVILQLIFHPALQDEIHYTNWKWFMITPSKLLFCLAGFLRTLSALTSISAFFVSTPEYDLIDGLNILLAPLKLLKIPVRYFILLMEIIFRFIPLLVDEAASIIKTQIIRGGLGQVKGKIAKIKAIVPCIVPLLIQTVKKSEILADAITMRSFK